MSEVKFKEFSDIDHETWTKLYDRLGECRKRWAHPIFVKGLNLLGMDRDKIPDFEAINSKLRLLTGWSIEPVEGLLDGPAFFKSLLSRVFPIGNFIRNQGDLGYTPAPDVFHDLYGHVPFLTDSKYANFCYQFAVKASRYISEPEKLKEFERFFWYGVEFPLINTSEGLKIFGGGILSSFGESAYSVSPAPRKSSFDPQVMRQKDFRIDVMQEELFVLNSPEELYQSISQFS